MKMNFLKKGFTLIELLVVIGILAVLMAGVVALIDPADKTKQANDARIQSVVANIATAQEAYAAQHDGLYANGVAALVSAGELKSDPSTTLPAGYSVSNIQVPNPCVSGSTCTGAVVCGVLTSKKYAGAGSAIWQYETSSGKTCVRTVAIANCNSAACP